MYYNDSENVIKYRNDTMWVDIGRVNAISDDKPADAPGAVYYDTSDNSIKYYNGTGWVDIGGSNATGGMAGGWEHNTTTGHVYNVNTGNIGIGQGTRRKSCTSSVGKTALFPHKTWCLLKEKAP